MQNRGAALEHLEARRLLSITAAEDFQPAAVATMWPTLLNNEDAALAEQAPGDNPSTSSESLPQLAAASSSTITPLDAVSSTQATAKDPQSKVWTYGGRWWIVLPDTTGSWVFRLDGTTWTPVLKIATSSGNKSDTLVVGDVVHVVLQKSATIQLASIEFVPGATPTYKLWTSRPALALISSTSGQSASIDVDSTGRMWMAQDTGAGATVQVRYSDAPYSTWSSPVTLATGLGTSEIAGIIAFGGNKIGVLWTNHIAERFGFKVHTDGNNPINWSSNEVPASQSAQNVGNGMADDHLHLAAGPDGTVYAAVKTAYDAHTTTAPEMALLVRRPSGNWDPMYGVDIHGTRPIVMLNELQGRLVYVYSGDSGFNDIVSKDILLSQLDPANPNKFVSQARQTLIGGGNNANPSSVKANFGSDLVVVAATNVSTVNGALITGSSSSVLTAGDATVSEGDSGTVNAVFTVMLSSPTGGTVKVNYATSNGTATAGPDYTSQSGTLTFSGSTTRRTITVSVKGDTLSEANETFFINLSNPVGADIGLAQGTGTIQDDDPIPVLSIDNETVNEGNTGTVNALFTLSLSAVSGQNVTVNYATVNGTASAPADFTAQAGTLTFTAGSTRQILTVAVIGDTLNEANETFTLALSNPVGASLASSQGTATILDDDPLPSVSAFNTSVAEGNAGSVSALVNVRLATVSGQTVLVTYTTADGSAVAPADYSPASGTLTFSPGSTTRSITIPVNGDVLDEINETFVVNLTGATNATISNPQATVTITDDDPAPALSIGDVSITEGDSGTSGAVFTVTLSAVSGQSVTVAFATADGSAAAGSDYTAQTGTLTFTPGTTVRTLTVPVIGDLVVENAENFLVNLSSAAGATLSRAQATGTITDNDVAPPTISISPRSVIEGDSSITNAVFTVTLSKSASQQITVSYATHDGSATAPNDYSAQSGTLTFSPGATEHWVTVAVLGETTPESDETYTVDLSNAVGAVISNGQGLGTIVNDDAPLPVLSIGNATVNEGNTGTTPAVLTVTLQPASSSQVVVNYATDDASATQPDDYTAQSGALTFDPGVTTQTITVQVNGDTQAESDESFTVGLSGASGASIGSGQASVTITDDDGPPTITISGATVVEDDAIAVTASFTVALSHASSQEVTVSFSTADGSAVSPADYPSTSGVLTFAAGTTTATISVDVQGDTLDEADESFTVNLSGASNATIGIGTATSTILDNDPLPSLSISDAAVAEGNSGSANAVFTVTLSAASGRDVSVNFATTNGTAASPADYASQNGALTFVAGTTSGTVTVAVAGDTLNESNETFSINLSGGVNASIGRAQGIGAINDDDAQPNLAIGNGNVNEGNSGSSSAVFNVTLSAASGQSVTVNYTTSDATATSPADYAAQSGTLTFDPGITSRSITIAVNGDTLVEGNETFVVNLSGAVNAGISGAQGTGNIIDDDFAASTYLFQDGAFPTSGYSGSRDTKLVSANPTTNYGTAGTMAMDGNPDESAVIKWDVTSVPAGSAVQSASITLNVTNATTDTYNIYDLKLAWDERTATWNVYSTANNWQVPGADGSVDRGSTVLGTISGSGLGMQTAALNAAGVAVVQSWIDNPSVNNGLVLQNYLTASDGLSINARETATPANRPKLSIVVGTAPANQPPQVNAGLDQSISVASAILDGTVSDDALPNPPGAVTTTWAQVSGPGTASFGNPSLVDTTATFNVNGTYVLRLSANDGAVTTSDDISIDVNVPPGNQPPQVNAGSDQSINSLSVNLDGTVTDDGLPIPPGTFTTTWSKTSGPGWVIFGDASAVDTSATFSVAGTYVLRLTADDGATTALDEVTLVAREGGTPVTVSFQDGALPSSAYAGTRDTKLISANPTLNYGTASSISMDGSPDEATIIKWDLTSIPAGSTVQSVTLNLNITNATADTYEVYEVKRPWDEASATWNQFSTGNNWQTPGADGSGDRGSTVLASLGPMALGTQSAALNAAGIALVQAWINNPAANNGFFFGDYLNATDGLSLNSRNNATIANRPKLTITYLTGGSPAPVATEQQNSANALDVNADGTVTSLDVLIIINRLNVADSTATSSLSGDSRYFVDVDGDGAVTPLDALIIINHLNGIDQAAAPVVPADAQVLPGQGLPEAAIALALANSSIEPSFGLDPGLGPLDRPVISSTSEMATLPALTADTTSQSASAPQSIVSRTNALDETDWEWFGTTDDETIAELGLERLTSG